MYGRTLTAALLLSACIASPAWGMYRCGKSYQQTPCEGNVPDTWVAPDKKPLFDATNTPLPPSRTGRRERQPPPPSPFAAECSRWGVLAQGVAAKRAGGTPMDVQVAGLPIGRRAEATRVIESVYTRRGTPPEIRAAVEKDCIAERQKAAEEAEAANALQPPAEAPAATPAAAKP
jgi:hypothetical protein